MIGSNNITLQSSFLDDFPKWILPSKNIRGDVSYTTKNLEQLFSFKIYITMEAGRSIKTQMK